MLQQMDDQQRLGHNKKLFFILLIYFAINVSIKWLDNNPAAHANAYRKITANTPLTIDELLQLLDYEQTYEGTWISPKQLTPYLKAIKGVFEMRLIRLVETRSNSYFELYLRVIDGTYVDDGTLELQFRCAKREFEAMIISPVLQVISIKNGSFFEGRFSQDQLLSTIQSGTANTKKLSFALSVSEENELSIGIALETEELELRLSLSKQDGQILRSLVLAMVMFVACFGTFSGLFTVLREVSEGGASRYSLATVCLASMWDTVVCMTLLVLAFSSQLNLMLFIVPAFLMCLVFTNLQPKLMILIFEAASTTVPRSPHAMLCRFNLLHYGSLFLVYPLVLLANFRPIFFLLVTCILFPQIYLNALTGTRPEPNSHYYRHFLLYRFLLVFYVRCFPYNIFRLKPDYPLALCCLLLLFLQYALLYLQKRYGPKKVVPRFLLPPRYDYAYDEETNVEENALAAECAICLTPLHSEPPQGSAVQLEVEGRVMRTPCQHRYHSACLVEWMQIKQNCPECRSQLPPYE